MPAAAKSRRLSFPPKPSRRKWRRRMRRTSRTAAPTFATTRCAKPCAPLRTAHASCPPLSPACARRRGRKRTAGAAARSATHAAWRTSRRSCGPCPSFAYSLPVHSVHARRDRVATLPTCRLHGAATQRVPPIGPGRALTLPCGWNNAGPLPTRSTALPPTSSCSRSSGTYTRSPRALRPSSARARSSPRSAPSRRCARTASGS